MMDSSNTGENSKNSGQFKKSDPRINRKGRPRSFDALRELSLQIAHEVAQTKDGQEVIIAGHRVSVAEIILRSWATSKNPVLQRAFIEIAYGKVPDKLELAGEMIVNLQWSVVDESDSEPAADAQGAGSNPQ
jgi:hypothetical protein